MSGEIAEKLSVPVKRGAKRKGAERRQMIIDAARSMLIHSGLSGLVTRDLAESLGITHGNVQYYFATKDDLLVAIFEQEVQRYTDSMHNAIVHASSRSAKISTIIDSALEEIKSESTVLWLMLHSLAKQNEVLKSILRDTNRKYDDALAEHLLLIEPNFSYERRRHVAQLIRMLLDGFSVQSVYDDLSTPEMVALLGELKAAVAGFFEVGRSDG